jgi:hypothetical protein
VKICEKCGQELMDEAVICMKCGCAVKSADKPKEVSYGEFVKGASTTNIVSAVALVLGVVCGLMVNALAGAALCLLSEIVSVIPNTKLRGALKRNNPGMDKSAFKEYAKNCTKNLKARYAGFKFSFVLSSLALIGVIAFALLM